MKKGFTLIELLIVVIILAILAALSLPVYNKIIKHTAFKEVASVANRVKGAAKYYDLKCDLSTLPADETAWGILKIAKPSGTGTGLTYIITSSDGDPALQVFYDGNMLYQYNIKTGNGVSTGIPDSAYLPADLP